MRPLGPGFDTSVVLRLLTGEPEDQAEQAARFFQTQVAKGVPPFVSDQVVSEVYFALCYHYQVPKSDALKVLGAFVNGGEVICLGVSGEILKQPNLSRAKPGFLDRVIHAQYVEAGAPALVTFEKASARLPGVLVLS
ncbi:MAG: type II toxin-antitoxin system VapC family toxin [Acidobacteria bacterium]|nr:MAG: type II toxin-antitoxin system VapC family toxin [Acidobacteriota bacterium]